jgi:hypothetical protein
MDQQGYKLIVFFHFFFQELPLEGASTFSAYIFPS